MLAQDVTITLTPFSKPIQKLTAKPVMQKCAEENLLMVMVSNYLINSTRLLGLALDTEKAKWLLFSKFMRKRPFEASFCHPSSSPTSLSNIFPS